MIGKANNKVLILVILLCLVAVRAYSLDAPHNTTNNISCDSCHYTYGSEPSLLIESLSYGLDIDDTQYNALCWSCHNDITAPYVRTHSSLQIDNGYGDWTIECKTCHNPHTQTQIKTYQTTGYLYQATVSSVDATTLTETGAGWTVNEYAGLILIPNIVNYRNYVYTIVSNTADTITVNGPIVLSKVTAGDTFAISYGKLIGNSLATPNSGTRTVRLFDSTGTNSFADGDAVYDGVCEVCHTQTTYHKNDATGNHTHNVGADCITCHWHTKGFKPAACNDCHGFPPTVNTATGGPDGLVNNPGVTGSAVAGAHGLHVTTKGFTCTNCHYNSAGSGATHNSGLTVTMGFNTFSGAQQGGSYDGQAGVNYNTTTTSPVTTVTNTGTKTCGTIYCHSTGQSTTVAADSTPTYAAPVWDTPASGACGTCHEVTEAGGLTSGSHGEHLGTTGVNGCGDCHTGAENDASAYSSSSHVNAAIDVANTYTAGGTPGNGYGTCSTASCHEDGTGTPVVSPAWGSSPSECTECHAEVPASGSHQKHVVTTNYNKPVCADCHESTVQGTTAPAQHLDGNLDVYDSVAGDLGYPVDVAKGGAPYESCTTAYCHSTGQSISDGNSATPSYATVTWGGTAVCGSCHNVTEAAGLTSGSHGEHLGATGVNGCGDCHIGAENDASAHNSVTHVDGNIDVENTYSAAGVPGNGYGTCSTASCHDDAAGNMIASPVWGSNPAACSACHDAVPTTGSHTKHLSTTNYNTAECGDCHDSAVESTTAPAQHLDGNIDVYDTAAGDLGYPQDVTKGGAPYDSCSTAYCHSTGQSTTDGNVSSPSYATVTWGDTAACGTCHKVTEASGLTSGSHAAHLGSSGVNGCGDCHTGAENDASAYNATTHVDASIDVANSYTAGGAAGNGYGNCTTNCHGSGTDTWGTDLSAYDTCTKCHGEKAASPTDAQKAPGGTGLDTNGDSAATDAQVGAHQAHMSLPSGYTNQLNSGGNCAECHKVPSAAGDAGHIDSALPAEIFPGTINPEKADLNSVTPGYAAGSCTVYCHGASMPKGSTGGSNTSPAWNDDTLLTGTPSLAGDCGVCHGAPPAISPHTGSETINDCDTCHLHFNDGGVLNNSALHINGTVEAAADCNVCHAYPPAVGDGKDYQDAPTSEGKGAHATHITNISAEKGVTLDAANDTFGAGAAAAVCGVCHTNISANHMTGSRMINFGDGSTAYQFGASAPAYNGVVGTSSGTTPKTCSNISCHFGESPTWQDPVTAGN